MFLTRGGLIVCCCVVHSNTHCCVCHSSYPGHVRGCRSLSATDDILTGSGMVRLTAQQRAELVQLHLQGESINAIVQQTGHARPCGDGCAASLLMARCWTGLAPVDH